VRGLHDRGELALGCSALLSVAGQARWRAAARLFRDVDRRCAADRGGTPAAAVAHADANRAALTEPDAASDPDANGDSEPNPGSDPNAGADPVADTEADSQPIANADRVGSDMSSDENLSPKEAARIDARERKKRRPKMIVDNAGVRRIQLALRDRAAVKKARVKPKAGDKRGKSRSPGKK
jgi:hypothetical protein